MGLKKKTVDQFFLGGRLLGGGGRLLHPLWIRHWNVYKIFNGSTQYDK